MAEQKEQKTSRNYWIEYGRGCPYLVFDCGWFCTMTPVLLRGGDCMHEDCPIPFQAKESPMNWTKKLREPEGLDGKHSNWPPNITLTSKDTTEGGRG
jgi:hypothetical protein